LSDYQLLDSLRPEEYEALKADIQKRGVLVPVEKDEDGNILDGHHRTLIADSLGIDYPVITRSFDTEAEKIEHVLKINLLRRHLGPVAWAEVFERLAEARGIRLGRGGDRKSTATDAVDSADALAIELGVKPRTARRRREIRDQVKDHPDIVEKVDAGEMSVKRAERVVREREAETRPPEPVPDLPPAIDIRHCSVAELEVEPESVDLIFTDPPYPAKYLETWEHLAAFARKALKPGGLLIAYSGQYHLPEVMHALVSELDYVWFGALRVPGAHNNVQQRRIRNLVKPLLFYSNGSYDPDRWIDDYVESEERQKDDHDWQQSIGAARYYIDRLTSPSELVADPFLGSGTTALAAFEMKRSFIGCDIDSKAVETAKRRVAE
jgi:ParB-like chromosome segregation protein Spo0J